MKLAEAVALDGPVGECFTHIDEVTGEHTSWAVAPLFNYCVSSGMETAPVAVEERHAKYCITDRGAEAERIKRLVQNPEYLRKPIVFVVMPDGEYLMIDGTHRYICYFALTFKTIPAYLVPYEQAKAFIIEDMPKRTEGDLMRYSYLTEMRDALKGQE